MIDKNYWFYYVTGVSFISGNLPFCHISSLHKWLKNMLNVHSMCFGNKLIEVYCNYIV